MKILNYKYIFLLVFVMLSSLFTLQAQPQRGARITNSGVEVKAPNKLAILDLDSAEKGFLLPRMTTVERDEIAINKQANNGLAIFNTTTDCIEYFNQSLDMWVSLCGDALPAEFSILDTQCDEIKILGGYYKDKVLNQTNGILIKVTVASPGTYSIYADSHNGYSFSAQGKFPDVGVYTILLKAEGKPSTGYPAGNKGDEIKLLLNGLASECIKYIYVDTELPKYTINSVNTNGQYFMDMDVTDKEYLSLNVNVTRAGTWVIKTDKANGVWYEGEGIFDGTGAKTIKLAANGRPITHGKSKLNIFKNPEYGSGTPQPDGTAEYITPDVTLAIVDCGNTKYSHQAELGKSLPNTATMTIKVDVKAPGKSQIFASNTSNNKKVTFQSEVIDFKYNREGSNQQNVVLKVKSTELTPGAGGALSMGVSGKGVTANCEIKMPVKINELTWDVNDIKLISKFNYGSDTSAKPYITPRTAMGTNGSNDYKIAVKLNVQAGGNITMQTNTVNGVYFKGTKTLATTFSGNTTVELKAYGTSGTDMKSADAKYTITSNHIDPSKRTSTINVDYVYRPMNVMGFGNYTVNVYVLKNPTNSDNANMMLRNPELFGWNGLVRVAELNMLDSNGDATRSINESTNTNMAPFLAKSDIVFVSGQLAKKSERLKELYDANVNQNVVLIYSERYNSIVTSSSITTDYFPAMTDYLSNFNSIAPTPLGHGPSKQTDGWVIKSKTNINNKHALLYDNRFFEKYDKSSNTITNTKFGGIERGGGMYSFSISNTSIPKGFNALYTRAKTPSEVTGLIHSNLGIILLFNESPFMGGRANNPLISLRNPLTTSGQTGANKNRPTINTNYGITDSNNSISVHNSFHLLNMMYWAIDYAQANQPNVVKPK